MASLPFTILIFGGTGAIGKHITNAIVSAGVSSGRSRCPLNVNLNVPIRSAGHENACTEIARKDDLTWFLAKTFLARRMRYLHGRHDAKLTSAASNSFLNGMPGLTLTVHAVTRKISGRARRVSRPPRLATRVLSAVQRRVRTHFDPRNRQ